MHERNPGVGTDAADFSICRPTGAGRLEMRENRNQIKIVSAEIGGL
jgi:hypothetical protein